MLRGIGTGSYSLLRATGLAIALLATLTGCAVATKPDSTGPLFYPSLPNPPRIQFLKTLSTQSDLGRKSSVLADFIAGDEDKATDLLNKPYGVAIYDGKVYVVDTRGSGYGIFDLQQKKFRFVAGSAGGAMRKPINITIDEAGNKFVTDTGRNQVLMFDRNDRFVRAYGTADQFKPSDVALIGNRLYIADVGKHSIHVLDRDTGSALFQIGKSGSKDGELFHPTNLAVGPDKTLFVSDTSNYRVQEFSADGKYLRKIGSVGSALGKFARPKGIAVDKDGRLYVVDAAFENVQIMSKEGKLLLFFGQPGDGPGDINLPTKVVVDYENVALFQQFAAPGFTVEYVVLVASQFGVNKINVYGFGKMAGIEYPPLSREAGGNR